MSFVSTRMSSAFHLCHSYVTGMSSICHSHVIRMSPVCTRMSSDSHIIRVSLVCGFTMNRFSWFIVKPQTSDKRVTYECLLVCHSYVICMYFYVIRMTLLNHPYVTRIYSHIIRMSLVCGFTMNRFSCHN